MPGAGNAGFGFRQRPLSFPLLHGERHEILRPASLRGIAILLFHDIRAGMARARIAAILPPLPAEDDTAGSGAEFGLVAVRPVTALARILLNQRL